MIRGITGTGQYTMASGGSSSFPYVPMNHSNPMQGMVRVNGQDLQVFDGSNWTTISASYASVGLTGEAESILNWAREKRNAENEARELAKRHPGVADLLDGVKEAEERLTAFVALVKQEEQQEKA